MTATPVIGLKNIGNICFVNSMMQSFASIQSIEDFLKVQVNPETSLEHGFLRLVQEELRRMKIENGPICLNEELLYCIYFQIFAGVEYNSQQDISELMTNFFESLKMVASQVYINNFGVTVSNSCPFGPNTSSLYYTLQLSVQQEENSIDIGEKLSNAVFLRPGQVCTCGQDRLHFYGQVPKCLIITVHKIDGYDRVNRCENIRRDVQIKCEPSHRINGQEYQMKAAVQYVGNTGNGGGILKKIRKVLHISKKSKSTTSDEISSDRMLEFPRAAVSETELSSPLKSEPVLEVESSPIQDSTLIVRRQVEFRSSPRNLPHMNNRSGHYTSYVKRGEDFFYISDKDVSQTSVVKTDDLCVLFYERK